MSTHATIHPASDVPPSNHHSPVDGMNIFWALFALTTASALHPLGSPLGFPPSLTKYLRILPLNSLLDTILLYTSLIQGRLSHGLPFRETARRIAVQRLKATPPSTPPSTSMGTSTGTGQGTGPGMGIGIETVTTAVDIFLAVLLLDMRARLLAAVGVVLVFVKLCGFHGVPLSLSLASVAFVAWLAAEGFLLFAFGVRKRIEREAESQPGAMIAASGLESGPEAGRGSGPGPGQGDGDGAVLLRGAAVVLTLGQLLGLLGAGIAFAVASRRSPGDGGDDGGAKAAADWVRRAAMWWFNVVAWPFAACFRVFGDKEGLWPFEGRVPQWFAVILWFFWTMFFVAPIYSVLGVLWIGVCFLHLSLVIGLVGFFVQVAQGLSEEYPAMEKWAAGMGVRRALFMARGLTLCLLVLSLVYYNVFWDGTGTWKEEWAGKLD